MEYKRKDRKRSIKLMLLGLVVCLSVQAQETRFAVISDVHVMSPSLLVEEGKAFTDYVAHDRKMLKESPVILDDLVEKLLAEHPAFVLLTGDLTKDGEEVSHRDVADRLEKLKAAGIRTLVIPGNHDVNNPHAVAFKGDTTERVHTVSAKEFADIYAPFGYGDALARDTASLSYLYAINDTLRILALDACKYEENDFDANVCRHDGRLKPETMAFIRKQVKDAREKGIRVLCMMHHGIVEHWKYQNRIAPGYLVDGWKKVADTFAKLGLEVVFTGHSHAQDITLRKKGKRMIYDIETGSSVSYPSPYRLVTFRGNTLDIRSRFIESIPTYRGELPFPEYAKTFLEAGVHNVVIDMFPKKLPDEVQELAANTIARYMVVSYRGDEQMTDADRQEIKRVGKLIRKHSFLWSKVFKAVSRSLLTDLTPADNDFTIELRSVK